MSTLLDSHEISSLQYMDFESDEEEEHERLADYDEQRIHAGTGGSSKMRSRPN